MNRYTMILTIICCTLLPDLASAQYTISGSFQVPFTTVDSPVEQYQPLSSLQAAEQAKIDLFRITDGTMSKIKTVSTSQGAFEMTDLEEGEYFLQVIVPMYLPVKKKFMLTSDTNFEIQLVEPIDYGNGPIVSDEDQFAGARHAFGCNTVSLIFVQWSGGDTWTTTLRNDAINAANAGMSDFEAQAPPGAKFRSIVESLGTYTVTSSIGNSCSAATAWIDEILVDMGHTSGTVASRLDTLAINRSTAQCGTASYCDNCGLQSSGFLFFITRDNSNPAGVGGWNCDGGRYQISYFGRSDNPEVYTHEIGHAFGTTDEYCVNLSSFGWYCCGWVGGNWGCTATGGCLNSTNNNCDPVCGQDCDAGTVGIQDCQDSCPAANCTSHTPCTMDGSSSTTFCDASRRQLGWVDSDFDGYLDCLENDCGTSTTSSASYPTCIQPYDVYVDGNWTGPELGTLDQPFDTVSEGYDAAHEGDTLNIRNGPFNETLIMDKNIDVEKWGTGTDVLIGSP